jgi:ankyrin repeat protein
MIGETSCDICLSSYDNFTKLKCSLHISTNGKSHYCCSECIGLLKTNICPLCRHYCDLDELKINLGYTKNMLVNAIINKNEKIALMLIKRQIDINYFDSDGRPILIYGCNYGLDKISFALIKSNFSNIIEKNYMYYFTYDILLICCENNMILSAIEMINCIKTKIQYHDIFDVLDNDGLNLIIYCIKNNRFEIFIELFQFYKSDDNITNIISRACHYNVEEFLIKFLDYIPEYNFDHVLVNCPFDFNNGNYNKDSLIMIMVKNKKPLIVHKLIDIYEKLIEKDNNKFKLDYSNKEDDTALTLACEYKLEDVALRLIKIYCKNITTLEISCYTLTSEYKKCGAVNKKSHTPLIIACINKLSMVALELLKTGRANQGVFDKLKKTALSYACENKLTNVALEILKIGKCSIDVRDLIYNKDAFTWACKNKLENVAIEILNYYRINKIKLLLLKDENGQTPLIISCKNRLSNVAMILVDIEFSNNKSNKRALDYAKSNNLMDVVKKMEKKINSIK